ncbi:hypothetical protein SAMN02745229_01520 [Butyrivibrio fibrisolvens DSM 3071]|uniref:Colicin import membrane protein n=1 Tax=Butyrivibrio fibrisolvens DSM 3071 TaxID=1121131 RepID=A0A1M5YI96_BUTFI|nr:DUF6465 family protein [Butyrivibrio fibrisolvens]SHI11750.1 hypothetical protein SAMN02745229_01520 [Butyrivibrio fibrisolvens DSM 3071]
MAENKTGDKIKKIKDSLTEVAQDLSEQAKPVINDIKDATKPVIENARKSAEPYVENIKSKAQPFIDDTMKKADPYIKKAKKAAEPAAKGIKEGSEKARKAAKFVSDDITRQVMKKNEKDEVYIQYKNIEVRTTDLLEKAREHYVASGHKLTDIQEVQVYVKPEDNKVYYVVNHKDIGKFDL